MTDHILVAGAGALGTVFGAFLSAAGHDVTLLGRAAHMDAITASGLEVEGLFGARRVPRLAVATRLEELTPPFDLVLLTVKSFDTAPMLAAVAPLLAPAGALV